ncbi:MAG TPA: hypothetical protein VF482_01005 [Trebonia sp.]
MPIGAIIAIVIVCVIVAAVAVVAGSQLSRRQALRRRFGAAYDHLARAVGPRDAQAELTRRQRLFDQLGIRPLTPEQRARYEGEWTRAQERFVEDPAQATRAAAALVAAVARDRGFSADDNAKLLKELSVGYSRELEGYRRALEAVARIRGAATEELRKAMIGYRAMFHELAGDPDSGAPVPESTTTTSTTASTAAGTIASQSTDEPVAVDARTKE